MHHPPPPATCLAASCRPRLCCCGCPPPHPVVRTSARPGRARHSAVWQAVPPWPGGPRPPSAATPRGSRRGHPARLAARPSPSLSGAWAATFYTTGSFPFHRLCSPLLTAHPFPAPPSRSPATRSFLCWRHGTATPLRDGRGGGAQDAPGRHRVGQDDRLPVVARHARRRASGQAQAGDGHLVR